MNTRYKNEYETRVDKSPEELEHDIEMTRHRMDQTVDQLADRLDPREQFSNLFDWARDQISSADGKKIREAGHKALDVVRENPLPMILGTAAVASAFLAKKRGEEEKEERKDQNDATPQNRFYAPGETPPPRVSAYSEWARSNGGHDPEEESTLEELKEKTNGALETAREKTADMITHAKVSVTDKVDSAGEILSEAKQSVSQYAANLTGKTSEKFQRGKEDHPISLGMGVAALGFLAALACPRTQKENELLGEKSDRLRDKAKAGKEDVKSAAKEKLAELKERSTEMIEDVADTATEKIEEHAECSKTNRELSADAAV